MTDAVTLLKLVQAVNGVITLAAQFNITLQQVAQAQKQAEAEGREFGIKDVQLIAEDADAALDNLRRVISEVNNT